MRCVMTVAGPVDPDDLGVTLMHEHVVADASCHFVFAKEATGRAGVNEPLSTDNLAAVRRQPLRVCLDNVIQGDEAMARDELAWFASEGGRTIVDCTVINIGRDPDVLYRISRATGVNIIMGTGCYTELSHPAWIASATIDEIEAVFVRDIREGVDQTRIRAGIIGEIGTSGTRKTQDGRIKSGDITHDEEKVLRAAGRASLRTGLAVSVHLDLRGKGAFRAIDVLTDEGVAPDRMVIGHLDQVQDLDYHREVAARGVTVEYDAFGRENYAGEYWFGSDEWRINAIATLVSEGLAGQLVLAQDICFKTDFRRWGGPGYAHILVNIIPMLHARGVADRHIHQMLVQNPRRILAADWDDEVLEAMRFDVRQAGLPGAAGSWWSRHGL
jgi:phosphotriesterase-related protein